MQNNLHITMHSFPYASRILKETDSLIRSGLVQHVYIAAIHEEGLMEHEVIDNAREVWRARLRSRKWSRSFMVQLFKYIEYCAKVIRYVQHKNIKTVNIHSVALLPLGVLIKWIYKIKLVYDAHELETETYGLRGLRQAIARVVERSLIRYVDLIIVVGNEINEWYRAKYHLLNVATVLNCPEFREPEHARLLNRELNIPEDKKVVICQGLLERGRGVESLLEVFAEYNDNQHVLVLMGFGELESLVRKYASLHSNIYFHEPVPPALVLRYTASADVGIAYIDNPSLNDQFCLPNKFFEYIMAGLPVIVNNAPAMRRIVNENKIGIVLNELTPQSLKNALDELARTDAAIMTENLRRAALKYSWQEQERVMINAYKKYV